MSGDGTAAEHLRLVSNSVPAGPLAETTDL